MKVTPWDETEVTFSGVFLREDEYQAGDVDVIDRDCDLEKSRSSHPSRLLTVRV